MMGGVLDTRFGPAHTARMDQPWISSPLAVLTSLAGTSAFFFFLERRTRWRMFTFFPPLLFVYAVPLLLANTGVLAPGGPMSDGLGRYLLPFMLVMLLLKVDVASAVRVMGRGVLVMLCGTAGVILGCPLAYLCVRSRLDPSAWKAFGALAGSWIGGTGNMAAVGQAIGASGTETGLAVLGDNLVYIVWLPLMLGSKALAGPFNRLTGANPRRVALLEQAGTAMDKGPEVPQMRHWLYLLTLGLSVTLASERLADRLPAVGAILTPAAWRVLLVTTLSLALSLTPASRLPGSHEMGMALLYLFVAHMGARADLTGLADQAPWFVLGACLWIALHGVCCLLGAWVLHADIGTAAIASAANIGGVGGAALVAGHHNPRLVPVGVLMALIGFALGNYGGLLAAWLCRVV